MEKVTSNYRGRGAIEGGMR